MSILTAFLRHPLLTGAVAASSPALGRPMTDGIGLEQARTVVEPASLVRYPVDAVVSGLPWTVMAEPVRLRILDAVTAVLAPTGVFTTFAYAHTAWTPPGRRFAGELAQRFGVTGTSRLVWRNVPPAFVHRASAPRRNVSRSLDPARVTP